MQQYAQQIEKVRQIAVAHVARCGGDSEELKQSFLFTGDHFVGVHFRAAGAEAKWLFGNQLVELIRVGKVIARIPFEEPVAEQVARRAA